MERAMHVLGLVLTGLAMRGGTMVGAQAPDTLMAVRLGPQEGSGVVVVVMRKAAASTRDRGELAAAVRRVVSQRTGATVQETPGSLEGRAHSVLSLEPGPSGYLVRATLPCPSATQAGAMDEIPLGSATVAQPGTALNDAVRMLLGRVADGCGAASTAAAPLGRDYTPTAGNLGPPPAGEGMVAGAARLVRTPSGSDAVATDEVDSISVEPTKVTLRMGDRIPGPLVVKVTGWSKGVPVTMRRALTVMDPTVVKTNMGYFEPVRVGETAVQVRQMVPGPSPRLGRVVAEFTVVVVP